jgi:hypothetical protein
MIGFGAIVKSIARKVEAAVSSVEARMEIAASALAGCRRKPALIPIPIRKAGRAR